MAECGSEKAEGNSFVLVSSEVKGAKLLWESDAVLFLKMRAWHSSEPVNFESIQLAECTETSDKVYENWKWTCVRWRSDDEVDPTFELGRAEEHANAWWLRNDWDWNRLKKWRERLCGLLQSWNWSTSQPLAYSWQEILSQRVRENQF